MNEEDGNILYWIWTLIVVYLVVWLDSLIGFMSIYIREIVIQAGAIYCLAFGGNLLCKRIH